MLTPDVTYRGMPLTGRSYDRHLDALRIFAKGPKCMGMFSERAWEDNASHEAIVAIGPLLGNYLSGSWYVYYLTEYGKLYASQRGIDAAQADAPLRGNPPGRRAHPTK